MGVNLQQDEPKLEKAVNGGQSMSSGRIDLNTGRPG